MNQPSATATPPSQRLLSLDLLRGMTVALMIMVNNGYGESFHQLQHSKWNGMTLCDLVFPFFLFIMGMSTYMSLRKTQFRWSRAVARKIIKRTLLLFLIGLFINWFELVCKGHPLDFGHLRLWAVMQRIALCYLAVSVIALSMSHRYILPVVGALLAAYAAVIVVGHGYDYDAATNILARADRALFGYDHLYHKSPVDPEGLLSTLPAIAHTLIGFWCCRLMMLAQATTDKIKRLAVVGLALIALGWLLSCWLPLNKRIWSPSYVLLTCGLASLLQGVIMWLVDVKGRHIAHERYMPLLVFGMNPLFLYVVSELLSILFSRLHISDAVYGLISPVITWPPLASLTYALLFTALHALMGWWLWRRRIFIKI